MTEEATQEDVKEQEVVTPEENGATETTDQPKEPDVGSKEYNFRQMEQKMQRLERQNYELMQEMQKAQTPPVQQEPDELSQLEADDLVTFGQVSKYTEKLAQKKVSELLEQELEKRERAKQPHVVKSKFEDYDQVVTAENIEQLIKEDPELEELIQKSKNPYERAYREVKKSDFWRARTSANAVGKRVEENSKKPISSNAAGSQRPLSQANSYSRDELYAEMMQFGQGGY